MSSSQAPLPVVGLLGGIAAGKTTVAKMFEELGAKVVSADEIAHAVLNDPDTRQRILGRWGGEVLDPGGQVNRKALAERVFGDAEETAALEAITHPAIVARMREQVAAAQRSPDALAVVVDAPLLLEAELDSLCDVLIFVHCPRKIRGQRSSERGWDPEELARRERHQTLLETKRQRADYVIDNHGTPENTREQVDQLWHEALEL
jgi:dephospho-CoA kinase